MSPTCRVVMFRNDDHKRGLRVCALARISVDVCARFCVCVFIGEFCEHVRVCDFSRCARVRKGWLSCSSLQQRLLVCRSPSASLSIVLRSIVAVFLHCNFSLLDFPSRISNKTCKLNSSLQVAVYFKLDFTSFRIPRRSFIFSISG